MFVVPELGAVVARFISLAEKVQADSRDDWGKLPPRRIAAAMSELEDALVRAEGKMGRDSESTATAEVSRLVDQALLLVAELAELAEATGMSETGRQVELLSIPLVVWSGRRKARIRVTAPVVNALAALANNTPSIFLRRPWARWMPSATPRMFASWCRTTISASRRRERFTERPPDDEIYRRFLSHPAFFRGLPPL